MALELRTSSVHPLVAEERARAAFTLATQVQARNEELVVQVSQLQSEVERITAVAASLTTANKDLTARLAAADSQLQSSIQVGAALGLHIRNTEAVPAIQRAEAAEREVVVTRRRGIVYALATGILASAVTVGAVLYLNRE